jgi:hypothetical protein
VSWIPRRNKSRSGTLRTATSDDVAHLARFAKTRSGVEAYIEPQTVVTATTVVLVAADGEWTRRRIDGPDAASTLAKKHAVPLYDAVKVGYPQRMREWTARHQSGGEARPGRLGPAT